MPGLTLLVYDALYRVQELRLSLHLVERHGLPAPKEGFGIAVRCVNYIEVVEGEKAPFAWRELLREGALSGLAGTSYDHCRHDAETIVKARCDEARKRSVDHLLNDNHSRRELQFKNRDLFVGFCHVVSPLRKIAKKGAIK